MGPAAAAGRAAGPRLVKFTEPRPRNLNIGKTALTSLVSLKGHARAPSRTRSRPVSLLSWPGPGA